MVEASLQLLVVIPTLIDKFWDNVRHVIELNISVTVLDKISNCV